MRHSWASVLLLLNLVACGLWPTSSIADKVKDRPVDGPVAVATLAGGCFWCMEPPFEKLPGV